MSSSVGTADSSRVAFGLESKVMGKDCESRCRVRCQSQRKPRQFAGALRSVLVVVVVALFVAPFEAMGNEPERVDVVVRLSPSADRAPVREFARARSGRVQYEYRLLPGLVSLRGIPSSELDTLAALPGVRSIEADRIVHASIHDSVPLIGGLQEQMVAAGFSATGAGVRVCFIDSGIRPDHVMFPGRIDAAAGYDFVNGDSDPADDFGHGTHVAGIAAGRTGLTVNFFGGSGVEPFQGVAPEVTIIAVKALDENGVGLSSDVIAAIDRCASPTLPGGPAQVINLSLGAGQFTTACDDDPLAAAANAAVDAGLVVIASSGNDGLDNALETPACGSNVIAVGATYDDPFPNPDFPFFTSFTFCTFQIGTTCLVECTDDLPRADDVACYSNQSDLIDVTAPGSYIWSADAFNEPHAVAAQHGTSQAAAHVTGLAALILSANPLLTPATVRQIIRDGSVDLGPPGFDRASGYGRIDVLNSLGLATASTCTVDADCDDGVFCNGLDRCVDASCEAGPAPCPGLLCRESDDSCVHCLDPADCDDSDPCNGTEICDSAGDCAAGAMNDCNENGILDSCDIDSGASVDCQSNGTPDECELASGQATDANGNGTLDVCDPPPLPPLADPLTPTRNRYIAFVPNNGTNPVAYRVALAAAEYFPSSVGALGWVSEPLEQGCPNCTGDFVARVVAEPVFRVWPEPLVHVGDCEIVPVATYVLAATVNLVEYSDALAVNTTPKPEAAFWADCVGPMSGGRWSLPDGHTNFDDIGAALFAFERIPGFVWPNVMRVDLQGNESSNAATDPPDYVANFADIQFIVQAFQGWPYPFSDPADCP